MNKELNHLKNYGYVILKTKKLHLLNKVKQEYLNIAAKIGINGELKNLSKENENKINRLNLVDWILYTRKIKMPSRMTKF